MTKSQNALYFVSKWSHERVDEEEVDDEYKESDDFLLTLCKNEVKVDFSTSDEEFSEDEKESSGDKETKWLNLSK